MSVLADDLVEAITLELSRACADHRQARAQRQAKDTPANRALEAECSASIDALLDMYLAAGATGPQRS